MYCLFQIMKIQVNNNSHRLPLSNFKVYRFCVVILLFGFGYVPTMLYFVCYYLLYLTLSAKTEEINTQNK